MKRIFSRLSALSTLEKYILPSLLVLFFIQFHYYKFFSQKFGEIAHYIDRSNTDTYDQIQSQHQYAELYKTAKTYKNTTTPVYVVITLHDNDFLDYTSTYYLKERNGVTQKPVYLTELEMMTRYFFYPRIIPTLSFKQFLSLKRTVGDILISDQDLRNIFPPTTNVAVIPTVPKQFISNVKKPPKPYYLFQVTQ